MGERSWCVGSSWCLSLLGSNMVSSWRASVFHCRCSCEMPHQPEHLHSARSLRVSQASGSRATLILSARPTSRLLQLTVYPLDVRGVFSRTHPRSPLRFCRLTTAPERYWRRSANGSRREPCSCGQLIPNDAKRGYIAPMDRKRRLLRRVSSLERMCSQDWCCRWRRCSCRRQRRHRRLTQTGQLIAIFITTIALHRLPQSPRSAPTPQSPPPPARPHRPATQNQPHR